MMTAIKERPILFSGAMVRALLAGTKTQTRRIVKVQPPDEGYKMGTLMSTTGDRRKEGQHFWGKYSGIGNDLLDRTEGYFPCPYGYRGDRLWVRETLFFSTCDDAWAYQADNEQVWADRPDDVFTAKILYGNKPAIPSIHMPREVSRILLEIVSVRVERLQDISEVDAVAEGIEQTEAWGGDWTWYQDYLNESTQLLARDSYRSLWAKINGPDSWQANPWVWVVEFKRLAA